MRREAGLSLKEFLLAVAVLLATAAIVAPVYLRTRQGSLERLDVERMRQVFVAMMVYEELNFSHPPPSLLALNPEVEPGIYQAARDPFVAVRAPAYPVEPGLPDREVESPVRISFAYLGNFVRLGLVPRERWPGPSGEGAAVFASEWHGRVRPTGEPFAATADGPVLRLQGDGSLTRREPRNRATRIGDPEQLFGF
jgi:type II secretory pathway pseudopilin PulG